MIDSITFNHIIIISNLKRGSIYSMQSLTAIHSENFRYWYPLWYTEEIITTIKEKPTTSRNGKLQNISRITTFIEL